jgi:arginine repressor
MKYLLAMIMLGTFSIQAMACGIGLRIEKNHTSISQQDISKFVSKITLGRYVIQDSGYKYLVSLRLSKRVLYDEPDQKIAVVSVDIYDAQNNLLIHTLASGKPTRTGIAAYSFLEYQKALVGVLKELPSCI